MANENKVIQLGQSYDPGMENIRDVTPEAARKMYVYKLAEEEAGKGFFIPGATTLLRIVDGDSEFSVMEEDKDSSGAFFTWALVNEDLSGYLSNTASASYLSTSLDYERQFQVLIQNFNQHGKNDRFLITFDAPYDVNEYLTKEQEAFILSSGSLADSTWFEYNTNNVVNETSTVFNLQSLHTIEDSNAYTKVIPYIAYSSPLEGLTELQVNFNQSTLLERITGLSKVNDSFIPLDFINYSFYSSLTPMKVYPTSIDNHLTCYFDWLDGDITMSETLAKKFMIQDTLGHDGVLLKDILTDIVDFHLVSDMILFTAGFQEQFKQVARNDDGKFEPKYKIGYSETPLSALVGQNPIEIISSLVDTYLKNHPSKKESAAFRTVTSIIAALSRYIISTYSIAGGNNSFNEFYLPWYLDAVNAFDIKMGTNNTLNIDENSLKFKLSSKWFDLKPDDTLPSIFDLSDINISAPRIKQLQNKFQMPELPAVIQSADLGKAFNPGAIDPSNPRELNYILYNISRKFESDSSVITNLLNASSKSIPKGTVYSVSSGEIEAPVFPIGVIPKPLIDSLAGPMPQGAKQHLMAYTKLLSVGYFGKEEPYNSEYRFIEDYIKPRIMSQLGITDASALDVSIPDMYLPTTYTTVASADRTIDNDRDVNGIAYANLLDNALIDLGSSSIYNLTKDQKLQLKRHSEGIFDGKDWQLTTDVLKDDVGFVIYDYFAEPISREDAQGVVRYQALQPREIIITFKKDIKINAFDEGKVLFNKSNWNKKIKGTEGLLQNPLYVRLDTDQADVSEDISQVKILEIKGLFMEGIRIENLKSHDLSTLVLEAPSNTDETITVFRIAFL